MYHSDLKITLGIVIGVLFSATLFLLVVKDNSENIYKSCQERGAYKYHDSRLIQCEVK